MKTLLVLFLGSILFFGSCISYQKSLYLQGNHPDTLTRPVSVSATYGLQPGDILKINFFTPDPKSAQMLDIEKENNGVANPANLYLNNTSVSDSGYIDIPLAGKIYVEGYTVLQVDSLLTIKAKEFFTYSSVEVKLAGYKFTAVGEFKKPGYTYVYNDRCTIFEAVALAGDATDVANKKKVVLVRPTPQGKDVVYHLDLTNYSVYNSQAFYIQPNDVLYIQPQKAKVDSKNIQYITLGFAAISTLLLAINFLNQ
ncbi:MAG: polysaccharide biosynthesis/export family protein [Cytophagaceae bacterium]